MGGFSLLHWIIILFIIVILFGASKLPKIGEGLGRGIRAFKDELGGEEKTKKPMPVALTMTKTKF